MMRCGTSTRSRHSVSAVCFLIGCLAVIGISFYRTPVGNRTVMVLSYAEAGTNGGRIDMANLEFFIRVAIRGTTPGTLDPTAKVDYIIVVNGEMCTPCDATLPRVLKLSDRPEGWVTVIYRENLGMDFGGFRHAVDWLAKHRPNVYKFHIFINSSLRGPFMPKWTPASFHFTDTILQKFHSDPKVKLVSSVISCLPEAEPVVGPISESYFFALDQESLQWALDAGVFGVHKEKFKTAVLSEMGLAKSILKRGGRIDSLLMRYRSGLDWNEKRHWRCNDNRHASRRGALENGISTHPLETLFVKISWCVRSAEVAQMTKWLVRLSAGESGTEGVFDAIGYDRGIHPSGTSSKSGTLVPDVKDNGCATGDISDLLIDATLPV